MTWKEFKDQVDKQLNEISLNEKIPEIAEGEIEIRYIDVSILHVDNIRVRLDEDYELIIS